MSTAGPKTITPPDGYEQLLAILAEHLDGGAEIPCTGRGSADWTAEHNPTVVSAAVSACQDCPALAACGAYAVASDERTGGVGWHDPAAT